MCSTSDTHVGTRLCAVRQIHMQRVLTTHTGSQGTPYLQGIPMDSYVRPLIYQDTRGTCSSPIESNTREQSKALTAP